MREASILRHRRRVIKVNRRKGSRKMHCLFVAATPDRRSSLPEIEVTPFRTDQEAEKERSRPRLRFRGQLALPCDFRRRIKMLAPTKIPPTTSIAGTPTPIAGAGPGLILCLAFALGTLVITAMQIQVAKVKYFIATTLLLANLAKVTTPQGRERQQSQNDRALTCYRSESKSIRITTYRNVFFYWTINAFLRSAACCLAPERSRQKRPSLTALAPAFASANSRRCETGPGRAST